jgi:glycosyltransferase involved in cell wall biosynthesis
MSRRRPVVFVSYNGLLDPLGKSQILSYLERLNQEWPIHVLSYEKPEKLAQEGALEAMEKHLADQRIGWIRMRYHQRPSLPATTYDMLSGVVALRRLIQREGIGLVHARGYLPMEIALNATRSTPTLFDIRGLQPEEYVDGGSWKVGELKHRLAKRSEARFFRRATGAVVLTESIRPYVEGRFAEYHSTPPPLEVIPCCVDLERFRFDAEARRQRRAELGVDDNTVVFVYSGSIGSWYLADEMAAFVRAFEARAKRDVFLLWTANNSHDLAERASAKAGLRPAQYRVISSRADEVAAVLSCADVGLALIKPCFSKRSSSPTKYAEYLSVGLPVVMSRNVGDGAVLEQERGAVGLGDAPSPKDIDDAVDRLTALLAKPREHFRDVAERLFDVDRVAIPVYRRLYEKLVAQ